jgi:hypothetical protein
MHNLPHYVESLALFAAVFSAFIAMLTAVAPRTREHRYHRWHVHDQRRRF